MEAPRIVSIVDSRIKAADEIFLRLGMMSGGVLKGLHFPRFKTARRRMALRSCGKSHELRFELKYISECGTSILKMGQDITETKQILELCRAHGV